MLVIITLTMVFVIMILPITPVFDSSCEMNKQEVSHDSKPTVVSHAVYKTVLT